MLTLTGTFSDGEGTLSLADANMQNFDEILLRVNAAAILVTGFEACMNFGFTAFAMKELGDAGKTNLLMATFWIALFVAELPTGYLVDRWGSRGSLIVSLLLRALAFVLFFVGTGSVLAIFFANFVAGIAATLLSGIFAAQVSNECRGADIDVDYGKLSKSALYVRSMGLIVGTVAGYVVVKTLDVSWLWVFSAAWALLTAAYVAAFWRSNSATQSVSMLAHYRSTLQSLRKADGLWVSTVMFTTYRTLLLPISGNAVIVLVPRLDGQPAALLFFYLLTGALGLAATRMYAQLEARADSGRHVLSVAAGICAVLIPLLPRPFNFFAFAGFLVVSNIAETKLRAEFYNRLEPERVGAISSVQSLMENGLGALVFVTGAVVIPLFSIRAIFVLFGVALPVVLWMTDWKIQSASRTQAISAAGPAP